MVKLVLLSLVLFFLFLITGSGIAKGIAREETYVGVLAVDSRVETGSTDLCGEMEWVNASDVMRKRIVPVKQFDLPGDIGDGWNTLVCKMLHPGPNVEMKGRMQMCYSSEFMRLLSTLHAKGFYLYFLRKLII